MFCEKDDLFVKLRIIGSPENIVNRNVVEIGKADKRLRGDVTLSGFIVAIRSLAAKYMVGNLLLCI